MDIPANAELTCSDHGSLIFWPISAIGNLDNKAAIQLIKEQTLDSARREVEFQLNLCGGDI